MDIVDPARKFQELVSEIGHLTQEERLIGAFNSVRDIPYGGANSPNPFDVLLKNRGTGKGKHILLKLLLNSLGCEVQEYWCKHDFGQMPIDPWPVALAPFQGKSIIGFHDFLKVKIGDKFVTIDATFDKPLKALGFPVLEWDGRTDMKLPVHELEIFPVEGPIEDHKQRLVASLSEQAREDRKQFLKTLKRWLDEERSRLSR